jgi:hypothetical protein
VGRALRAGLLAVVAAALLTPAAQAAPLVGIGEQKPRMFSDPAWQALGLRDVRIVVSWNAIHIPFERREIDAYMAAAERSGARVLVAFGRSRTRRGTRVLPGPVRYARAFRKFRRRWPGPRTFVAWNEANHCSQPTCRRPDRAAAYFDALRSACPRCTVVAADVLDSPDMVGWVTAFRRAARHRPTLWGLHNYLDANRFTTRGTRALLRAVRGNVWFTETGGLVERSNRSPIRFPDSRAHAAEATDWLFGRLVRLSPRVRRVYLYHWRPAEEVGATWDSALVDRDGEPRPAYRVLRIWLRRAERAARWRGGA